MAIIGVKIKKRTKTVILVSLFFALALFSVLGAMRILRADSHAVVESYVEASFVELSKGDVPRISKRSSPSQIDAIADLANNVSPASRTEILEYFVGEWACKIYTESGEEYVVVVEDRGTLFGLVQASDLTFKRIYHVENDEI